MELLPVILTTFAYFALLISVGFIFKKFVGDGADFFRSGSRATWWMVGTSVFMAGFSAWTFTGAAAMAFNHGWSVLGIFVMVPLALVIQGLIFARRFRQLRATTVPELIRLRYNPLTQQVYAILTAFQYMLLGAVQLYALAIFISAFFGVPVIETTIVLGLVIGCYIVLGGSWAAIGADNLQALIVVGIVAVVSFLALSLVGGLSGLFAEIRAQDLSHEFRFLKSPGEVSMGNFTLFWLLAMATLYLFEGASFTNAVKYFAAKDGRHACYAAWFGACLALLGALIWFIPPMVARLRFPELVAAAPLARPEEGAFAVAALQLLPTHLWGLLAVAIMGATISSMDTTINRNSAILVRDVAPPLARFFPFLVKGREVVRGRLVSSFLCVTVVLLAIYYSTSQSLGVFDLLQRILAMVALPMTIPLALGMLIRKTPSWSALVSCGAGLSVSVFAVVSQSFYGAEPWTFARTVFTTGSISCAGFFGSMLFNHLTTHPSSTSVADFFERMKRPIDFAAEVGDANDLQQMKAMSLLIALAGGFLMILSSITILSHGSRPVLVLSVIMLAIAGILALLSRRKVS